VASAQRPTSNVQLAEVARSKFQERLIAFLESPQLSDEVEVLREIVEDLSDDVTIDSATIG